ncbi:MAG TPA: putative baseplate assembly protein [Solirubrobacteraceae bacterium]|nr:putative baseplate assembly protein [Solirubrobacteraceae bacterium]
MTLPELNLDDRTFQELVSEARLKVMAACEFTGWTEHNVSDPGITLIELFAWMTEMTIYRLNRVPEKIHLALLDLLGLGLDPPEAASVDVWFRLKQAAAEDIRISAFDTEVATPRTPDAGPVIFQIQENFTIPGLRPVSYVVEHGGKLESVSVAADGAAKPSGPTQQPFGTLTDRTLYLGFDRNPSQLIIRVDAQCAQAHGTGVKPSDPPLHWYVSEGPGQWSERLKVIEDHTGGFNNPSGFVELLVPRSGKRAAIDHRLNRELYWLRCRLEEVTRGGHPAERFQPDGRLYRDPPYIWSITARAVGASLLATHTTLVENEALGKSDGTVGQTLKLRHAPVLPLDPDRDPEEVLEVSYPGQDGWQAWYPCDSFATCHHEGRHFAFDAPRGEITLPPAIRDHHLDPHDEEREQHEAEAEAEIASEQKEPADDEPGEIEQRQRSESHPRIGDFIGQHPDGNLGSDGSTTDGRVNGPRGAPGGGRDRRRHHNAYWERLGKVPPRGSEFRMKAYRHGGGQRGNVMENMLTVLRSSIPEVATVTNPIPATGGREGGSLDLARQRARHELRTRQRAVTVEDFEYLAMHASIRVGRAKCVVPGDESVLYPGWELEPDAEKAASHLVPGPDPVTVYILAAHENQEERVTADEVKPGTALLRQVQTYLDRCRLLGCVVEVKPALLLEVTVEVTVETFARTSLARVESDVEANLHRFLNPLVGTTVRGGQRGWGFGRSLNPGEIHGVIHRVYGVKSVLDLAIKVRDPRSMGEPEAIDTQYKLQPAQVVVSGVHKVIAKPLGGPS